MFRGTCLMADVPPGEDPRVRHLVSVDDRRVTSATFDRVLPEAADAQLRAVPLLFVSDGEGFARTIAVGICIVTTEGDEAPITVRTVVQNAWQSSHRERGRARASTYAVTRLENAPGETPGDMAGSLPTKVRAHLEEHVAAAVPARIPEGGAQAVTEVAKALAEASRDKVSELREVRYALEEKLAQASDESKAVSQASVVAALLNLGVVADRARGIARETDREGLWLHLTDSATYHAYRRLQDPRLLIDVQQATAASTPWMRVHDAAIRQGKAMLSQLDEECSSIRSLLNAAASISSSQEADTQQRFNVIAAIASIALGLPALVLTLYGASVMLPMDESRLPLFLPVAIALMTAAVIAIWQGVALKRGLMWILAAVLVLALVGLLLFWAGAAASTASI